ncbi:hypothetical protein AYO22_04884 [Fonsecaea multimorphosa]|nr:hypothetical protein AYO22_04884 [Fonsecaea multimorphosa]
MSYFRITLIRSAIGLPAKSGNVLKALGLRKRMATVFHPVTPSVAGQIMKVKELVAVSEVDEPLTKQEIHQERVPDPGFYVESRAQDVHHFYSRPHQDAVAVSNHLNGSGQMAALVSHEEKKSAVTSLRAAAMRRIDLQTSPRRSPSLHAPCTRRRRCVKSVSSIAAA